MNRVCGIIERQVAQLRLDVSQKTLQKKKNVSDERERKQPSSACLYCGEFAAQCSVTQLQLDFGDSYRGRFRLRGRK